VRVGFGSITCQRYPGDRRSTVELYQEGIELAEEAERLGFDSVWASEHHFFDDGYLPSVLPMCAAIAARTTRTTVGTDVLLGPLHQPIRLAEDAAVVDLISGGRFVLGVGLGWRLEEFEGLGVDRARRRWLLEDEVAVLREAWSERLVSALGVAVTPKPTRAGGPPIWLGGVAEAAVRRAARIGDGFFASWSTLASFEQQVAWVRDELARAGRDSDGFQLAIVHPTFAWDREDAWARIRDAFWHYAWKYEDMATARGRTGPPGPPPRLSSSREKELRDLIVLGRPNEVADRLLAYEQVAGGSLHFVAEFCWPGLEPAVQREALAVFAEVVRIVRSTA
jgi:alkanesulfonate monooxygenase SsuD/methylene tetrahydromethanopterin reductase-like flavin-dependent oxidoreductase (luciferase family)